MLTRMIRLGRFIVACGRCDFAIWRLVIFCVVDAGGQFFVLGFEICFVLFFFSRCFCFLLFLFAMFFFSPHHVFFARGQKTHPAPHTPTHTKPTSRCFEQVGNTGTQGGIIEGHG